MQGLVSFGIVVAISVFLALPSAVALLRRHPNWIAITVVSILSGWTVIGWIATLCWALRRPRKRDNGRWFKMLRSKVRGMRRPAPTAVRLNGGANDNVSDRRAGTADLLPDIVMPDPYETWLDCGEAMAPEAASREDHGSFEKVRIAA